MQWCPSFEQCARPDREGFGYRVRHPVIDEFLEFVAGRARPNTARVYAHDLKVFLEVVGKDLVDVEPADVLAFVSAQRRPR